MNKGRYELIGDIIGSGITLLGIYLILKYNSKPEFKKLIFSFLSEKKSIIENVIERCSSFQYKDYYEDRRKAAVTFMAD